MPRSHRSQKSWVAETVPIGKERPEAPELPRSRRAEDRGVLPDEHVNDEPDVLDPFHPVEALVVERGDGFDVLDARIGVEAVVERREVLGSSGSPQQRHDPIGVVGGDAFGLEAHVHLRERRGEREVRRRNAELGDRVH